MNHSDHAPSARTRPVVVLLMALALAVNACGSSTTTSTAPSQVRIGYLSGGDSDPFVFTTTQSVKSAAKGAGVFLFECDANFLDATALACANTMATQNLNAVINWQFTAALSPAVCKAYGNLPTVGMDTVQAPCQKVFVGADGHRAGVVAGMGLGQFAQTNLGCKYDLYVSIEHSGLPDVSKARGGGSREGFESVCGAIPQDKFRVLDKVLGGADRLSNVRRQMTDILTTVPNAHTVLVMGSFGDPDAETALAAAKTAGREKDVYIAAHGADPSSCHYIRTSPQWVGDVGYFPENYGGLAVPAAIALAKGQSTQPNYYVDHSFITKANIDQFYPACF